MQKEDLQEENDYDEDEEEKYSEFGELKINQTINTRDSNFNSIQNPLSVEESVKTENVLRISHQHQTSLRLLSELNQNIPQAMKENTFRQIGIPKTPDDFIESDTDVMTPTYKMAVEEKRVNRFC